MVRSLIVGLCIAAVAAIAALVSGDFSDTHARIVGTSLGFSFFCALGASGDALRVQSTGVTAKAGAVASASTVLAFGLLVLAIWIPDASDTLWRTWGVSAVCALWASHWSLVLRARRVGDSSAVRAIVVISILTATVDMLIGNIAIAGLLDDVSDGMARALGVVLVVTVLTTALAPIIRRLTGPPRADTFGRRLTIADLAHEIAAAAARLERVETAADVQREADALRRLAERAHD